MDKILLADDDIELCALLSEYLLAENFQVTEVYDGETAIQHALEEDYDVMILDIMMPRLNGLEVLKRLQNKIQIPILMLTARGDDIDRILGLELGADDYLPKPCNPRELVARLRAILRRTQKEPIEAVVSQSVITVGDLTLNRHNRTVLVKQKTINLTSTEFNVLDTLIKQAGQIVNKETLTEESLFRKQTVYDRSVEMHVSKIRKKLGSHMDGSQRIKTIRGLGYLYAPAETK
ncbi:MAG: response regulator transcription factor [Methylococcaceae bacterium]